MRVFSSSKGTGDSWNRTYKICKYIEPKFRSARPLEKIVTDVACINHNNKWYYLTGYLDLFNNEIVDWELSDVFDNLLVIRSAERLLQKKMSTEHQRCPVLISRL